MQPALGQLTASSRPQCGEPGQHGQQKKGDAGHLADHLAAIFDHAVVAEGARGQQQCQRQQPDQRAMQAPRECVECDKRDEQVGHDHQPSLEQANAKELKRECDR
jgi:hypothetical protein